MQKNLKFSITFESKGLDNDWTKEQWDIISNSIYCSLEGIEVSVDVPKRDSWIDEYNCEVVEKGITIEPTSHPILL